MGQNFPHFHSLPPLSSPIPYFGLPPPRPIMGSGGASFDSQRVLGSRTPINLRYFKPKSVHKNLGIFFKFDPRQLLPDGPFLKFLNPQISMMQYASPPPEMSAPISYFGQPPSDVRTLSHEDIQVPLQFLARWNVAYPPPPRPTKPYISK